MVDRADVKKKNPDASITEVSKACGAAWGSIDGSLKSKFEKKAEEAKKVNLSLPLIGCYTTIFTSDWLM